MTVVRMRGTGFFVSFFHKSGEIMRADQPS